MSSMNLQKLKLFDFRSYADKEIELGEGTTWVVGPNAVGKTNILEAIRLISMGESFRADRIEETVNFGKEFGKVEAVIDDENGEKKLSVLLNRGELQGKKVAKRKYFIDDVSKRKMDFLGMLPSVVFRPEDLELFSGSPSVRRNWLNDILCQTDKNYARSLVTYEQAVRRRNKILEAIREGISNRYQLTFWDGLVVKHGMELTDKRIALVEYINQIWRKSELFSKLELTLDSSIISEKRLAQYEKEEVAAGHTLVGPHKEDWLVKNEQGRDISAYGSRGQQRMAVLGLKMGELLYLEEQLNKKPILLLDDIFSELDAEHIKEVYRVMVGRQVVVTTTDTNDVGDLPKQIVLNLKYD